MPSLFFHRTTMACSPFGVVWLAVALAFVEHMRSTLELLQLHWFDAPRVCGRVLQLCYGEIFAMAAAGRKRDIAIRVMVTAKEQAEIRKAANKAAMPMSVYVRAKALEASRGAR